MPGNSEGWDSADHAFRAQFGLSQSRSMLYILGGSPFTSATGNTSAQILLDGGPSRMRIPSTLIGAMLRGGMQMDLMLSVQNNTGAARSIALLASVLLAANVTLQQPAATIPSDNIEYLIRARYFYNALSNGTGSAAAVPCVAHAEMIDGSGLVTWNTGATGVPVTRATNVQANVDCTVDSTPLIRVTADVINAALTIRLYSLQVEMMAGNFTPAFP
jgi:hypothetical protein